MSKTKSLTFKSKDLLLAGAAAAGVIYCIHKRKKSGVQGVGAIQTIITGKVCLVKYRNTSYYGNNSYWVFIETTDGRYLQAYTAANSALGYEINNMEGKTVAFNATRRKDGGIVLHSTTHDYDFKGDRV